MNETIVYVVYSDIGPEFVFDDMPRAEAFVTMNDREYKIMALRV